MEGVTKQIVKELMERLDSLLLIPFLELVFVELVGQVTVHSGFLVVLDMILTVIMV